MSDRMGSCIGWVGKTCLGVTVSRASLVMKENVLVNRGCPWRNSPGQVEEGRPLMSPFPPNCPLPAQNFYPLDLLSQ